jgi:hypothetical protein
LDSCSNFSHLESSSVPPPPPPPDYTFQFRCSRADVFSLTGIFSIHTQRHTHAGVIYHRSERRTGQTEAAENPNRTANWSPAAQSSLASACRQSKQL